MKILLVNNSTKHLINLRSALSGHEIEIVNYRPGVRFNEAGKDLIILSGGGGEGREANDITRHGKLWYEDEMHFVQSCQKPILGICMGFEVIAQSYGSDVPELAELVDGFRHVTTTRLGKVKIGSSRLQQLEAHKWHVPRVSTKHFDVLADSPTGIEIIKHKKRPIIATQFHPEVKGGTISLDQMMRSTLALG